MTQDDPSLHAHTFTYLFVLKHHSAGGEGGGGGSPQVAHVFQGVSPSVLLFLIVAVALLCFLGCYSLQNGMQGWRIYFQYNSESKDNLKTRDLHVNCKALSLCKYKEN